jgi:AcrR family transcriptional regulator
VVTACGLSVGATYDYFPSKDELIRQSIDSAVRDESAKLLADTQPAGSVSERLDRSIRDWCPADRGGLRPRTGFGAARKSGDGAPARCWGPR